MKKTVFALILCAASVTAQAGWQEAVTATEHGDYGAAEQQLRLLAPQGDDLAQIARGVELREGRIVPQKDALTHMWTNLAASRMPAREDRSPVGKFRDFAKTQKVPDNVGEARPLARKPMPKADIERLQFYLYLYGHPPGPIDGVAGAKTRSAIRAFEREQGLPETGHPTHELSELVFRRVVEYLTAAE